MEVYPTDGPFDLVEADVVKPFETCTGDSPHSMIGDEEIFFPSHEHVLALRKVAVGEVGPPGLFGKRTPSRESGPVVHVSLLRRAPRFVPGLESVLGSNDFALEEGCQGWVILRETCIRDESIRS